MTDTASSGGSSTNTGSAPPGVDGASVASVPAPALGRIVGRRRTEIASDLARAVLAETSYRLVEAMADYEAALDRRAIMSELQFFDREVARAGRDHEAARRAHATAGPDDPDAPAPRRELDTA